MHDLRKQAILESGKTISRKARSRQATPTHSKPNSPTSSRATSRDRLSHSRTVSADDSDHGIDEDLSLSALSIEEELGTSVEALSLTAYEKELADRIDEIFLRKGSTTIGREKCLQTYTQLLVSAYAESQIYGKDEELARAFLKSIKEVRSDHEVALAAEALAITIITSPSDLTYDLAHGPLKTALGSTSLSATSKKALFRALSMITFYGGASDSDIAEVMDFMLQTAVSEGQIIFSSGSDELVVSALQEWSFLCTLIDDFSSQSDEIIDQLVTLISDTGSADVRIAAAESVALLYEKSLHYLDDDNDDDGKSLDDDRLANAEIVHDSDDETEVKSPQALRLYRPYRQHHQLLELLRAEARCQNGSVHRISKVNRKALKTNLTDVANSIQYPCRGPRYSDAIDDETGKRYGSRMIIKVGKKSCIRINRWWKLVRIHALRRVLRSGLLIHLERNEAVAESLPMSPNG